VLEKGFIRDVEVRELARKELHICKHCANRFYKEELLLIMENRKKLIKW